MFDVERPYLRLLWAYFLVLVSVHSTEYSPACFVNTLYFPHRSLVINVNSICVDRFMTYSELSTPFYSRKCIL